jgi:hypothetical protein
MNSELLLKREDDTWRAFAVAFEAVLAAGRAFSWDEVLRRAEQARSKVRAALTNFADAPTRAVEWFQDDTFDHYEEHAAQIEAFARQPRDS